MKFSELNPFRKKDVVPVEPLVNNGPTVGASEASLNVPQTNWDPLQTARPAMPETSTSLTPDSPVGDTVTVEAPMATAPIESSLPTPDVAPIMPAVDSAPIASDLPPANVTVDSAPAEPILGATSAPIETTDTPELPAPIASTPSDQQAA